MSEQLKTGSIPEAEGRMSSKIFCFGLVVISLGVMLALVWGTPWGVGTGPDSAKYIGAARNFLAGKGLTLPLVLDEVPAMTHYPPLYPFVLACGGYLGLDPLNGARWLNVLLAGLNVFVIGCLLYSYTRSYPVALAGAALVASSPVMISIYLWASSEPLFIPFVLLGILWLACYFDDPRRLYLIVSAGFCGLAFLTRYPGVAVIAAGVAALMLFGRSSFGGRIRDSAVFLSLSVFPMILWTVRNIAVAGTAADRHLQINSISRHQFLFGLDTIAGWFVPFSVAGRAGYLAVFLVIGAIAAAFFRSATLEDDSQGHSLSRLPSIILLVFLFYAGMLALTVLFVDETTPLDNRILSPFHVLGIVLVFSLGARFLKIRFSIMQTSVVFALCAALVIYYVVGGVAALEESREYGLGLSAKRWQTSPEVERLKSLSEEVVIYTNRPHAVYLLTGRSSRLIPEKSSGGASEQYLAEVAVLKEQLERQEAVVIQFEVSDAQWDQLRQEPSR